ncbi:redoxin domain-containing protein [Tamlana haliotis]|uniref:Redoxin domain-containing protein n=1 Tax=Pseudotamlana haliotis TaxID=2614804 RepID=A0A6N6MPE2_9FLAO|nr:deiodinase-like protein [Tamlana haliotis]KAB1070355.1 redoxin domain-containing protein [Tamlana haliotis]
MEKESSYNYKHFNPKDYNFKNFKGPKGGEEYIDFEATTLDGKTVKLSDFLDKTIVLDTGSITCPMYANTTGPMNLLQKEFPDFHFILLYVREAHPGGRTKEITTFSEKIDNAKATSKLYNEKRKVLVDSVDGFAHKLYGSMPNMTYVIGKDGIIKFRANWTNINALKKVLLSPDKIESKDYYSVVKPPFNIALRTLLIGGVRALYEFLKGLPQLMKQHKEVDSK